MRRPGLFLVYRLHCVTQPQTPSHDPATLCLVSDDNQRPRPGAAPDRDWAPDILGAGFTACTIDLGPDPDGETDVVATVVRHAPDGADAPGFADRDAVLLIHGMSDYFFQDHVAARLHAAGYACYAVDLRKCGRSHRPGQTRHHVTEISRYDADLDAAVDLVLAAGHPRVVPLGHSTGGLILGLWLDRIRRLAPDRHARIPGAVFNSPWLELPFTGPRLPLTKAVTATMARLRPNMWTPDKGLPAYGDSIHASRHGDWDFDLAHKPLAGFEKRFSWLDAVRRAQRRLQRGVEAGVPCLVLHSDASRLNAPYAPATDTADAVLVVDHIVRHAPKLGSDVELVAIPGARHDVYLSREHAREQALRLTLSFLDRVTAG